MKDNKPLWDKEEKDDDLDVYDEDGIELSTENDELSDEEAGFMKGYLGDEEELNIESQ